MGVPISEIREAGGLKPWLDRMKVTVARPALPPAPKKPKPARIPEHGHQPNQTEQRYHDEFLVPRILTGEIVECEYEGRTFELCRDCRYTPDWWVTLANGLAEAHEVKGKMVWEDSRIKVKWAAQKFPEVRFVWAQWKGGVWRVKLVEG